MFDASVQKKIGAGFFSQSKNANTFPRYFPGLSTQLSKFCIILEPSRHTLHLVGMAMPRCDGTRTRSPWLGGRLKSWEWFTLVVKFQVFQKPLVDLG